MCFNAGGDHSPLKRSSDPDAPYYTWDPDFRGHLMYDFENPDLTAEFQSVRRVQTQIAKVVGIEDDGGRKKYNYEEGG